MYQRELFVLYHTLAKKNIERKSYLKINNDVKSF